METLPASSSFPPMSPGNLSLLIVGIGASAGGLEAFTQLLAHLPDDTGMGYVLVQHLDPTHPSLLSDLLARVTKMPVQEIRQDLLVEPDHVYVLSPGTDLTLENGVLKPEPRTHTDGLHLPIDAFFRSLAAQQKHQAIGVVLSGTASDGTLGLKAIKAAGGMTFAQDATAQFQGMPQSALAAGSVDALLPPEGIVRELLRISQHSYVRPAHMADPDLESPERAQELPEPERESSEHEQAFPDDEQVFQQILTQLRQRTGVNFAAYKPPTIKRRLLRRLALHQQESLAEYAVFLREHPSEVEALYQDLLINVTSFFRDPLAFQAVTHEVFPALFKTHVSGEALRVWVTGCSTGEEVYSLAICLLEYGEAHSLTPLLQIFGTDIDEMAIKHARTGSYLPSAVEGVSPERLQRFFQRVDGRYQIHKSIRDVCVFARHNVCIDPPFSRVDLLSCRNLLIYLGPAMQKKVLHTFHYALKPGGFLLLGSSETVGADFPLFAPVDKKQKVYTKKVSSVRPTFDRVMPRTRGAHQNRSKEEPMRPERDVNEGDAQNEADALLLAHYVPASVVIDQTMEVQHFRGHTSPYLAPAAGKASFNLFKMAHESLMLPLRTAIHQARTSGERVKKEGIELLSHDGSHGAVTVEVLPLKDGFFLVLFEEASLPSLQADAAPLSEKQATETGTPDAKDRRITTLQQERAATREEMRSVVEELEAANEELQSANEEILSSNEELQSLNEELETSKEEIQASNEELIVINQELKQRQEQLQEARAFAEAIVETIREPLLVLNADLRVQSANAAFYRFFQIEPADIEQMLLFDLDHGQWNIPALRTLLEELLPTSHAFADYEVENAFPKIGRKTMLLNAHRIDHVPLILLAMEDNTDRKQTEQDQQRMLEQREEFMAIASHELKTPVTSLKGYTQMLHSRFDKAGDERSASMLAKMEMQINKLIKLIGTLLDVTKIEAGKLFWDHERFDLDALVRETVEDMGHMSERQQVRIEGAVKTFVSGDRERISQVLTNLLSNAIKYAPQADTVVVTLEADADAATVGVQDFGIGIAPEKQARVFDRFFRVNESEHQTFPGLGLGLYISAEIVKRHGGRMWVESREGEGATFFFTVLLAPGRASGPVQQESEELHA
ncbi:MAG: chemotaxis protein CheB [Ktedonobacteraceae bacterium]